MQSVSCAPGQSFIIEGPEGRTRVTVIDVGDDGVRLGVDEAGMHYREVFLATDDKSTAGGSLLATVG